MRFWPPFFQLSTKMAEYYFLSRSQSQRYLDFKFKTCEQLKIMILKNHNASPVNDKPQKIIWLFIINTEVISGG